MNNNEGKVNWDKNNISNNNNSNNEKKNNSINRNDLMKKIKTKTHKNKDSNANHKSNNNDNSSGKYSNPWHFSKSQGKFFLSFLCTLFFIFLRPKNHKSRLWKVS